MLPESKILQNKLHNAAVVNLILEQRVPLNKLPVKKKPAKSFFGLSDTTPEEELAKQFSQALAIEIQAAKTQYDIKGLTGDQTPHFIADETIDWLSKKYKIDKNAVYRKNFITKSYPSYAAYIADIIWLSKGTIKDNENNAMRAVLAIKSAKQFNQVQKEFQKKSGGQGIGQFIFDIFGTYTTDKSGKAQNLVSNLLTRGHADTANRLQRILTHLENIGANPKSIEYVQKALNNAKGINIVKKVAWNSPQLKTIKTAYEYRHEIALVASLIAPFILPFGLAISSGIMLADAGMHVAEGNYLEAGYSAIFALLPGIGGIASKIPAIAKLEAKGMAALGRKLALSKNPVLNRLELSIIKDMGKYQHLIKSDLNAYFGARFENEMIHAIKIAKYPTIRKILYLLGTGTIKASVLGGRLLKFGIKTFVPYSIAESAWEKAYVSSGLQAQEVTLKTNRAIADKNKKFFDTFYKNK